MADRHECPGCLGRKSPHWRLCAECFEIYGHDIDDWPAWLLFNVNSARREMHQSRLIASNEVPLEWTEYGVVPDGPLRTRGDNEVIGALGLPYAPYADEALNRQYRQANGIQER